MKKQWQKPQLVVLLRSKPEEAVLTACKSWLASQGPANQFNVCKQDAGCDRCEVLNRT